jgi:nitrous oxidase accessory protein
LLINSPAIQVIRWAQAQFPALFPGGVTDTAPLMTPPAVAVPAWTGPS